MNNSIIMNCVTLYIPAVVIMILGLVVMIASAVFSGYKKVTELMMFTGVAIFCAAGFLNQFYITHYKDKIMTKASEEFIFNLQGKLANYRNDLLNGKDVSSPELSGEEAEYILFCLEDDVKKFFDAKREQENQKMLKSLKGHNCNEEMPSCIDDNDYLVHFVETDSYLVVHFAGRELFDSAGEFKGTVDEIDMWYSIGQ